VLRPLVRSRPPKGSALKRSRPLLGAGPAKDKLLQKIKQLNTAIHVNDWFCSPGLRPSEQPTNDDLAPSTQGRSRDQSLGSTGS